LCLLFNIYLVQNNKKIWNTLYTLKFNKFSVYNIYDNTILVRLLQKFISKNFYLLSVRGDKTILKNLWYTIQLYNYIAPYFYKRAKRAFHFRSKSRDREIGNSRIYIHARNKIVLTLIMFFHTIGLQICEYNSTCCDNDRKFPRQRNYGVAFAISSSLHRGITLSRLSYLPSPFILCSICSQM